MSYQSDFEGLEGWDYAVIVACLGGFLILGLLVRLLRSIQPEIEWNTWHKNSGYCSEYQCRNRIRALEWIRDACTLDKTFSDIPARRQEIPGGLLPLGQKHALPTGTILVRKFPRWDFSRKTWLDWGLSVRVQHWRLALHRAGGIGCINRNRSGQHIRKCSIESTLSTNSNWFKYWCVSQKYQYVNQDNSIPLYQVVPSASKVEANNLNKFELNLDHPGGKWIGK